MPADKTEIERSSHFDLSLGDWLFLLLQLLLAAFAIHFLNVEIDLGLVYLFPLIVVTFALYSMVGVRWRLYVLLAGFVLGLFLVLGAWNASVLLILGLVLVSICHMKVPVLVKGVLLLFVAVLLALARFGVIPFPMSQLALRILAALFMFRLILYFYEIRHEKVPRSWAERLSYFFMLPNIVFPLFPIVDYKSFFQKYYDRPSYIIYQKGVNLILWSLICLLSYRVIYLYAIPNIEQIDTLSEVAVYHITTYLSVIRLIGILSFSVGVMRLFGFNLPEIFNYMFLSHSFSDFFRRINIYWKNFLMKVIYYPVYFRIRKWKLSNAMLITFFITFLFTWFFHIYQWAWIIGENPIRPTGIAYWASFAILATISSSLESRKKKDFSQISTCLIHSSKIVGTFLLMSLLYTMWTHPTIRSWIEVLIVAGDAGAVEWVRLLGLVLIAIALGAACIWVYYNWKAMERMRISTPTWGIVSFVVLAVGVMMLLTVGRSENEEWKAFVADNKLNINEEEKEYLGYYDGILKADVGSKLWDDSYFINFRDRKDRQEKWLSDLLKKWKKNTPKKRKGVVVDHWLDRPYLIKDNTVLRASILPNYDTTIVGKRFSTNQWGMRDQHYAKAKDPNTIRIAVLGGSPSMGVGVGDESTFEAQLEEMLNDHLQNDPKIEILNFAMEGIRVYQQAYILDRKAVDFDLDYVMVIEHFQPIHYQSHYIIDHVSEGKSLYPELETVLENSKYDVYQPMTVPNKILLGREVVKWSYEWIQEICATNDMDLIVCMLPGRFRSRKTETIEHMRIFDDLNIDPINLQDIYENHEVDSVRISLRQPYPNESAHQMIAARMYLPILEKLKNDTNHE